MKTFSNETARYYAKGIGDAVADRTINRKITEKVTPYKKIIGIPRQDDTSLDSEVASHAKLQGFVIDGYEVKYGDSSVVVVELNVVGHTRTETWGDVAERVAYGSASLEPRGEQEVRQEHASLLYHLRQASILMSGRHLQHGDENQSSRNMEVFTNCATSAASFLTFYLLLNGAGVGRCYDNSIIVVNFNNLPIVVPVCDMTHGDVQTGEVHTLDRRSAEHLYANKTVHIFEVPDSREGWAKAVEKMELMAFKEIYREDVLLIDFSKVRPRGSPIGGMQDRPASGPGPLITAIRNVAALREANMEPWRAAMYADHYLAECVLVGGARRAARMSTKSWKDQNVLSFIEVKRGGFLWSSNNSVTVDAEFWRYVNMEAEDVQLTRYDQFHATHAKRVFNAICEAAYFDGTGEPGIINVDKLSWNKEGIDELSDGNFAESERYKLETETLEMMKELYSAWQECDYKVITNPCVPYETPILTDKGYVEIGTAVGQEVNIWNGHEFSKVTPFATGYNPTVKVILSDGSELRCTPEHKFVLSNDKFNLEGDRVKAKDLLPGDKLAKYSMPVVIVGEEYGVDKELYSQGFYSGNRSIDSTCSLLYFTRYLCEFRLKGTFEEEYDPANGKIWKHGVMKSKDWVPVNGYIGCCLSWLAGLFDSQGEVCTDAKGNESFSITSTHKEFLLKIQLMLSRLGVQSKVIRETENKDGVIEHFYKICYGLIICEFDFYALKNLGMVTSRIGRNTTKVPVKPEHKHVEVIEVIEDEPCETYCLTEPKNHTATFNGIVTGQCGEIVLGSLGGYCVIADVVPFHSKDDDDAEDAFRVATRALIRTNTMDALYGKEVKRTNRIGVGITGLHEWAWARFGFGWKDIVNESTSKEMWLTLGRFKRAVQEEAETYSKELGIVAPHTNTTMKPAGCVSLDTAIRTTEGALTMRELFEKHGITEILIRNIDNDTWVYPKYKILVLDEDNIEREITKLYLNGVKPVYEIEFEDGTIVKLTGNHKLKTNSGQWKRVDELTISDEILHY